MRTMLQLLCLAVVAIIVGLASLQGAKKRRNALKMYWDRRCTGKLWRVRFPEASKDEIRRFLQMFVDAFAFRESQRLKFSPEDEIMGIYRALYPERDWPDALELETLTKMLREEYDIDLVKSWTDGMTLGSLFLLTKQKTR